MTNGSDKHSVNKHKGTKSIIIDASREDCYNAICNFQSYPSWQKTVKKVKVLEKDSRGRPALVELKMDFFFTVIRLVNRYEYYDEEYTLSWRMEEGGPKFNIGNYIFQKLRDDRTNAIFFSEVELNFYVPKKVADYLVNITMRGSMKSLKNVVEKGLLKKG